MTTEEIAEYEVYDHDGCLILCIFNRMGEVEGVYTGFEGDQYEILSSILAGLNKCGGCMEDRALERYNLAERTDRSAEELYELDLGNLIISGLCF